MPQTPPLEWVRRRPSGTVFFSEKERPIECVDEYPSRRSSVSEIKRGANVVAVKVGWNIIELFTSRSSCPT
jgi:hypothetical protein